MSTATLPEQQRFVFDGIRWDQYLGWDALLEDRRVRLTYDRGKLEFMTLSLIHERVKMLFHNLILVLTEEFEVPRLDGGSTTFRREDLERGLEPDQCYYLENEPLVRAKDEIDLTIDPPPDLSVEIEISRSVLDRLGILAALGVPEVWCSNGETARFLRLQASGEYEEVPQSPHFPGIRSEDFIPFLKQRTQTDAQSLMKSFRDWVHSRRSAHEEYQA